MSRNSSVGIAKGYSLDGRSSSSRKGSTLSVQTVSGIHPANSQMGTGGGGGLIMDKSVGTWYWPLTPSGVDIEIMELYLHSPHISS
jgi:hypothetical protein